MRHNSLLERTTSGIAAIGAVDASLVTGRVHSISGQSIDIAGLGALISVGARLDIVTRDRRMIAAEVVGFRGSFARVMAFGSFDGIGPGSLALIAPHTSVSAQCGFSTLAPCDGWLGRVLDPLGLPLDGHGALPRGERSRPVRAAPPDATTRARLGPRLDLGVAALNLFTTCRTGQRLGLFAGSGVGKSTLLAMLARHAKCDVTVLALVGERGREVREFIEDDLGRDGLARSVVIVATSDATPLLRREAAYAALTVAEHFRDEGKSVLLLMDSVTRFCLALREIGLSAGEPPATRGYPSSVFSELPRLLERAGPGAEANGKVGQITAFFTVLVEGDDHNEPVADAVRGILDGHVVLERRIAEAGRFPAIDVLRSLSRSVPGCLLVAERKAVDWARALLATYAEVSDLVRLGAYKAGLDPTVDEAVTLAPRVEALLRQNRQTTTTAVDNFAALANLMEGRNA